jgi:dUTP pyrophosphatase
MNVKIKLFDTKLPVPNYQSSGAACIDLYARVDTVIQPHDIGYIPLNVALEIPEGYFVLLTSRSSTHKQGLMPANGIGIGDWDFKGDDDEYHFPVYNFTNSAVTIVRGHRIAQMMILSYNTIELSVVTKLNSINRGMFGTTGNT